MSGSDSRVLVFGIGAPRAGTTWLWNYLKSQCPTHVKLFRLKELHVWDRVCLPSTKKSHHEYEMHERFELTRCDRAHLRVMRKIPAYYFLYLRWVLRNEGSVTSDITPAYCALSRENFATIRKWVRKCGIEMKVVFLMRDPVERCVSSFYSYRRLCELFGFKSPDLKEFCISEGARLRTRYQRTIVNLEAAFREDELFFGIYENLFEERSIVALSDFLDMPSNPAFGKKHHNPRPSTQAVVEINDDTRRFIAETYKDTYSFCARRFPQTRELWGGFRWLDGTLPG